MTDFLWTRGSRVTFEPSGGTEPFILTSLGAGAGRISDRYDLGAFPNGAHLSAQLRTEFETAPVLGEVVRIHLVEWFTHRDATVYGPGDLGASDAAIATESLLDGIPMVGRIIVNRTTTTNDYVSPMIHVFTLAEQISWLVWNATADALSSTAADHELAMWVNNLNTP